MLVGKEGGQLDFLSTQGYSKQGLPGDMLPNNATTNFVNTEFGLAFHSDSAFLRGMLEKTSADDARQRQRRGHPGALRERHRQQSAQSDVRHREGRRARASC